MDLLPEWAPSVHPLVVHFPIAVLAVASLFDGAGLVWRRSTWLTKAALVLYGLGAAASLAAYLSGKQAADLLAPPAGLIADLTAHADWAEWTVWFYALFFILRTGFAWFEARSSDQQRLGLRALVVLLGLVGYILVFETAEHGAKLVFLHGAGVQSAAHATEPVLPASAPDSVYVAERSDGGWTLRTGTTTPDVSLRDLTFVQGAPSAITATTATQDSALVLAVSKSPVLITAGGKLPGVEAVVEWDLSAFNGRARLVYSLQDATTYDYLEVYEGQLRQGRLENGVAQHFDTQPLDVPTWATLQAISHGTHFRGYHDGKLVTHGHGDEPPAGTVGLFLDGSGMVRIRHLAASPIE